MLTVNEFYFQVHYLKNYKVLKEIFRNYYQDPKILYVLFRIVNLFLLFNPIVLFF